MNTERICSSEFLAHFPRPVNKEGADFDQIKECLSDAETTELESGAISELYYFGEDLTWSERKANTFVKGQHIQFRYRLDSDAVIAPGSHGNVYKARDMKTDQSVVIKIARSEEATETLRREFDGMASIRADAKEHSGYNNLIHAIDGFQSRFGYAVVYPLMDGDMIDFLKNKAGRWDVSLIQNFAASVLRAIECMDSKEAAHCDIKPDNVLVCSSKNQASCVQFKLADFGLVTKYGKVREGMSSKYAPPEIVQYHSQSDRFRFLKSVVTGPQADMVSLGMAILAICSSGRFDAFRDYHELVPRFDLSVRHVVEEAITMSEDGRELKTSDPETFKQFVDFVSGLVHGDPKRRLPLKHALQHPFLSTMWSRGSSASTSTDISSV